jgi:hypothetical protein
MKDNRQQSQQEMAEASPTLGEIAPIDLREQRRSALSRLGTPKVHRKASFGVAVVFEEPNLGLADCLQLALTTHYIEECLQGVARLPETDAVNRDNRPRLVRRNHQTASFSCSSSVRPVFSIMLTIAFWDDGSVSGQPAPPIFAPD